MSTRFNGTYQSFDNFFSQSNFDSFFGSLHVSSREKPIIEQCKKDAIDYFVPMGIRVDIKHARIMLDPDTKYRIFLFLKSRKEHYGREGLLVTEA